MPEMKIQKTDFGQTPGGVGISLFTLTNSTGSSASFIDYGAILVSLKIPDRDGNRLNVNLGYENLDGYLDRHPYFGSTVGRFCNRIALGQFTLDGQLYELAVNNGPNHLHGGIEGFDKLLWDAEEFEAEGLAGVRFRTVSPAGQEGYPGTLTVVAEYTWNDACELKYTFQAETDAPTVLNLTNHAYWNLAGAGQGDVLGHEVKLNCDRFLAVDDNLIPTGELSSVDGSPLDFSQYRTLGERIKELPATLGYDHCYVINGEAGELRSCGIARDPGSGRTMEVLTTQPGVQLYTGNHLEPDKHNSQLAAHGGFCLETQHYPDSPNQPEFPSTRLDPGTTFQETTVHRFSVT